MWRKSRGNQATLPDRGIQPRSARAVPHAGKHQQHARAGDIGLALGALEDQQHPPADRESGLCRSRLADG